MFQRFYTYIFISFCIVTLLCSGCSHTYVIKNVSSINHEEVKGNPRIALVGFYPYTSTLVDKTYSQNYTEYKYSIDIDKKYSLKSFCSVGKDIKELTSKGIRKDVDEAKIKLFITSVVDKTGNSILSELNWMFTVKDNKTYLNDIDADYFLVGIFSPYKESRSNKNYNFFVELIIYMTLGIIPQRTFYESEATFYLYDRNLNEVHTFTYSFDYEKIEGLFVDQKNDIRSTDSVCPPPLVWIPHVKKLNTELISYLNK